VPDGGRVPLSREQDGAAEQSDKAGFADFYQTNYRELIKTAMYAGATRQEAEDVVSITMENVLQRWAEIDHPRGYARRAVISNLVKEKTRGLRRVRQRQAEHGLGSREKSEDAGLTVWEDRQWVRQVLDSLPDAQREVMALIFDGFAPSEVAALLDKTPGAVRQNLCAARQRLRVTLREEYGSEVRQLRPTGSATEVTSER
jgi:RNA polymerase sigma factor (sigma-70 family)